MLLRGKRCSLRQPRLSGLVPSDDGRWRSACLGCSDVMAFTVAGAGSPAIMNLSRDNTRSAGHPMCRRVRIAVGDEPILIIEVQ